jgi:hypothetical protein
MVCPGKNFLFSGEPHPKKIMSSKFGFSYALVKAFSVFNWGL